MKRFRKTLTALVFALVLALTAIPLGCGEDDDGKKATDTVKYTVTFERTSGDPFAETQIFADHVETGRTFRGRTDKQGTFSFDGPKGEYSIEIAVPEGYEAFHKLSDKKPTQKFTLAASLMSTPPAAAQSYTIGSVMHDFTYTDTLGRSSSLGELLKTKKAVVLNFWFINCSICIEEFPGMQAAYEKYKDKIEILGLNYTDDKAETEAFRQNVDGIWAWDELTFPMVSNEQTIPGQLFTSFHGTGCPTTALIDQEGVVCMLVSGGGTQEEFEELFETYTADDYKQIIQFPETGELVKPNVASPSSERIAAAVSGTGFTADYAPLADEYNWPWVIGSDNKSIVPSNTGYRSSRSALNIKFTANEGQILAFDYKTSSEQYDKLHVIVDGTLINSFAGIMSDFQTCYAYVPVKPTGDYTLTLAYVKDSSKNSGDDTVTVKNIRFVDAVGSRTVIPYRCAGGALDTGGDFTEYVTTVYNADDGYYHVGTATGPLVVADLLNYVKWSDRSAWDLVMGNVKLAGDIDGDGKDEDYTDIFLHYITVSNNSLVNGQIAVTQDLRDSLVILTQMFGNKKGNKNEWLDLCYYHVVYAGEQGEIYADPARGLATHNAFPAVISPTADEANPTLNHVVKTQALMPRGYFYSIKPTETAVYSVRSVGNVDTEGWLLDENGKEIAYSDNSENSAVGDLYNFSITELLRAGKTYYAVVDFNSVDATGEFDFVVQMLGTSGSVWTPASSGVYYSVLDEQENVIGYEVADAVEYVLGDDKCYHVKNADGSAGPLLYVSMLEPTNIFPSQAVEKMLNIESYYCTQCGSVYPSSVKAFEDAASVKCYCGNIDKTLFTKNKAFNLPTPLTDHEGKIPVLAFTQGVDNNNYYLYQYVAMYELNTDADISSQNEYLTYLRKDGIKFTDYTSVMQKYIADSKNLDKVAKDANELGGNKGNAYKGFIPATEELVDILQKFIIFGDYSMSPQVGNAWLMMASYFLPLGE